MGQYNSRECCTFEMDNCVSRECSTNVTRNIEKDNSTDVITNIEYIMDIVKSENKLDDFRTILDIRDSINISKTLCNFSKFVILINNFHKTNKYKINDNLVNNLNKMFDIFLEYDTYGNTKTTEKIISETTEINNQNYIQKLFLEIISKYKADPDSIDNYINSFTECIKKIAITIPNQNESDLNIEEFKKALKIFIQDNSSGISSCKHFNKYNFEDMQTYDIQSFIKMIICTNCNILEDSHFICNKYIHNEDTYYCNDCGMRQNLHKVCNAFKRDDSELSLYYEGNKHCTDCGRTRKDHLLLLKENGALPCDMYNDDEFTHCKTCNFSLSDHNYINIIHTFESNIKFNFDLIILEINLELQQNIKNIFTNIIVTTIMNFVNSKNHYIYEYYLNKYKDMS
jgi:hypothetical protein